MNVLERAGRSVVRVANASTSAAGAVGGAAVNGVVGGVKGTATGVREGLASGSHSVPTAALTLAAVGLTGLVEWPLLVTVGGAALVIRQLGEQKRRDTAKTLTVAPTPLRAAPSPSAQGGNGSRPRARKSASRRTNKSPSA